ncbi:HAMP domain-containing sensor histidine kinase [Patulibacter sp.]|uniref:sensor histidine kinase n=1 Tax=Patulibacter sp. TaxID=1912859 RepID=UPI00271CDCB1|nr:HAMP domain-containing sensor histidine kinase [Patulibacter sp.]MDO9407064.1 HAMP domain-containing sensor histidine kinase [Patulibacter sp.]
MAGDSATAVRIWTRTGRRYTPIFASPGRGVDLGDPGSDEDRVGDYRVETRRFNRQLVTPGGSPAERQVPFGGSTGSSSSPFGTTPGFGSYRVTTAVDLVVQVGRSYDAIQRTTRRVWSALGLGVVLGSFLALWGGLALGARAMRPVRRMTSTARHIARTRDLDAKMPPSRVHDEIAELGATLQDMLDELSAAQATVDATLQRQREFIADASHELRTPLTSVQANLELLALTTTGDDREAAESALRSSRRMRRLVADLLLLARMDASRETERAEVDLDRAILEAVDELEPQIGDHSVALDIDPVAIDGIRDELVRMVANLVGNALRHTPEGTEIRVRLRSEGTRGELVVEDDGHGIPEDLRQRIFDRFVRRGGEGAGSTGIGLAIVRAAARRHGGDVRVEATDEETGRGARFVVTLAVLPADPDGPSGTLADEAGGALWSGAATTDVSSPRRVVRRIQRRLQGPYRPYADGEAEAEAAAQAGADRDAGGGAGSPPEDDTASAPVDPDDRPERD